MGNSLRRFPASYAITNLHNSFTRFIRFSVLCLLNHEIPFREYVGNFRQYFNSHTGKKNAEALKDLNQLIFYCASRRATHENIVLNRSRLREIMMIISEKERPSD